MRSDLLSLLPLHITDPSYTLSITRLTTMHHQIEIQEKFEALLKTDYSTLQPINKWKQTMWHQDGNIIVSLVLLSKKIKFCFFNNPNIELDKLQRWGSTVYSQNLEYKNQDVVDWDRVRELVEDTLAIY